MKNHIAVSLFILMLFLTHVSLAQMPPASNLPHKLTGSEDIAYLDIDNDGTIDFIVIYLSFGMESISYIVGSTLPRSPEPLPPLGDAPNNMIIVEYLEGFSPPSVATFNESSPLAAPLSEPIGPPFTRMMSYGEMIGPTAPAGSEWYNASYIHTSEDFFLTAPLGGNSYEDGLLSGYIGVYFYGLSGWTFGWINVQIANDGSWVLIKSAGFSPTGTPIPAGLGDPTVVPLSVLATLLGFGAVGGGIYFRKKNRKRKSIHSL